MPPVFAPTDHILRSGVTVVRRQGVDFFSSCLVQRFVGARHVADNRFTPTHWRANAIKHGGRIWVRLDGAVGVPERRAISLLVLFHDVFCTLWVAASKIQVTSRPRASVLSYDDFPSIA